MWVAWLQEIQEGLEITLTASRLMNKSQIYQERDLGLSTHTSPKWLDIKEYAYGAEDPTDWDIMVFSLDFTCYGAHGETYIFPHYKNVSCGPFLT